MIVYQQTKDDELCVMLEQLRLHLQESSSDTDEDDNESIVSSHENVVEVEDKSSTDSFWNQKEVSGLKELFKDASILAKFGNLHLNQLESAVCLAGA